MSGQGFLKHRHSVTTLVVHMIFTTKYRRKLLDGYMINQIKEATLSACERLECELLEIDGEEDRVHMLLSYPPKQSVSVIVNNLKSTTSRYVRQLNPQLQRQSKGSALWSRFYFATSAEV